ncbi:hypothetical protein HDV04_005047 [Boothiomyces sp. JEL0838]|nr:hypothetical protein HDV04_005047 [Boothiomyces sp. JEL0838]
MYYHLISPDYIHKISLIEEALQQRSILERHFSALDNVFSIFDSELKKRLDYFDQLDRPLVIRKEDGKKSRKHRRAIAKKLRKEKPSIPARTDSQHSITITDLEKKSVDSDSESLEHLSQSSEQFVNPEFESDQDTEKSSDTDFGSTISDSPTSEKMAPDSKDKVDLDSLSMIEKLTLSSPSLLEKIE